MVTKKAGTVEEPPKYDQTPSRLERRMTAKQFDALVPRLHRVTESRVAAARRVLVDGVGVTEAGAEFDLPKQRVRDIVDKVSRLKDDIPVNWVRVRVWLPPAQAQKAVALSEKCKAKAKAEREE